MLSSVWKVTVWELKMAKKLRQNRADHDDDDDDGRYYKQHDATLSPPHCYQGAAF